MILYVAKCRQCGFQLHSTYCIDFKKSMAQHLNKSHHDDYDCVSEIPLNDFKETFVVTRIRDAEVVKTLLSVFGNRGYWKAIRFHPQLQNLPFSGLSSGEN